MANPTDIRKGRVLNYNNAPHLVLDMQHRTQGRQAGFVQVTMRNMDTGSSTVQKFRSTESVEFMVTDTQRLEYSYEDQDGVHFLHPETFEDIILDPTLMEEAKVFMSEGNQYDVLFVDDRAVQVQLPASVELEVAEAPEMIKGDTSSAATKPVTTVTGLIVQTPLFVKVGDKIKINTESKEYQGRA